MRFSRIVLSAALVFISVGLFSCNERIQTARPTESEIGEGGQIAFRLAAADLALLGPGIDSVRIDAVRAGYPSRSALGGLNQTTLLEGLPSGPWTLKVALFDASQAIHWYGEAVVQVLPGKLVDAEVRLRKATGSVRVRILLDDTSALEPPKPGFDTLKMAPIPVGDTSAWADLPVGSVSRTDAGIYLETKYDCNVKPVVLQETVMDSGKRAIAFRPVTHRMSTMIACDTRAHFLFIPIGRDVDVLILNLASTYRVRLPGKSIVGPVVDTGRLADTIFKQFESIEYNYVQSRQTSLLLTGDGRVVRQFSGLTGIREALSPADTAWVSGDSLRVVRHLVGQASFRKLSSSYACPVPGATGPVDAPSTVRSRYVTYADGHVSAMKKTDSEVCDLPQAWLDMNRIDEMLRSVFVWN